MPESQSTDLVEVQKLELDLANIKREIAQSDSIDDLRELHNQADAIRRYVKSSRLGLEVQNKAAEIRLRADRRAGLLLAELGLRGGDRRSDDHKERVTLGSIGVTRNESTRWQRIARLDKATFDHRIAEIIRAAEELTTNRLLSHTKPDPPSPEAPESNPAESNSELADYEFKAPTSMAAAIEELVEHHRLLTELLSTILDSDSITIEQAVRRHLRYLCDEISNALTYARVHLEDGES